MKTYVNQVLYCQANGSQIIELSDDNYLLLSKVDKILTLDPLTSKSIGSSNYFDVSVHQFLILVTVIVCPIKGSKDIDQIVPIVN